MRGWVIAGLLCLAVLAAEGGGQIKVNRAPASSRGSMPGKPFSGKAKKQQLRAKKANKAADDGGDDLSGWGRKRLNGLAGLKAKVEGAKARFGAGGGGGGGSGGGGGGGRGGGRPPRQLNLGEKYGLKSLKTVFEREPQVWNRSRVWQIGVW